MPWLSKAVASVDAQRDGLRIEHIVFDAGSTDGSREWLTAHPHPDRTDIFAADDGQADALQRGFARARGRCLGWLNADDVLEPGALALAAAALVDDVVCVSGACFVIDADGNFVSLISNLEASTTEGLLHRAGNLPQPATFFTRAAYLRCGGIDPALVYAMDVDLWLKLSKVGRVVRRPDRVLARFRVHGGAKTVQHAKRALWEDLRVRLRAGLPPWSVAAARMGATIVDAPTPTKLAKRLARALLIDR